jgi:hypothetical protein
LGGTAGAYLAISVESGNNVISFGGYDGITSATTAMFNLGGTGTNFTIGIGSGNSATVAFAAGGTLTLAGFGTDTARNAFTAIGFGNGTGFNAGTGTGTFTTAAIPVFS